MNLSSEQEAEILRLHGQGLSQNAISNELQISKPYVNAVIRKHVYNLGGTNLPVNLPVKTSPLPVESNSEIYYLKRQIADLEDRLKTYKEDYSTEKITSARLQKELDLLKVDYNTQEQRHKLELEKKDLITQTQAKSGLNGLVDNTLGKFTNNEKFMDAFGAGLAKVIENKFLGGESQNQSLPQHPLAQDPEVQSMISQIQQALNALDKTRLRMLFDMLGCFLHEKMAGLIEATHEQVVKYTEEKTKTQ